jgi:hypothetical protein
MTRGAEEIEEAMVSVAMKLTALVLLVARSIAYMTIGRLEAVFFFL